MDWLFRYADPSLDWGYALIALLVRFVGVFAVMLVMQVALQIAARAVRRLERGSETAPATREASAGTGSGEGKKLDGPTLAAIGLGLAQQRQGPPRRVAGKASNWATAGRLQQVARRPR